MSTQPTLFDTSPTPERDPSFSVRPRHDGPGLEAADQRRLGTLLSRVHQLMSDGEWRTLPEIAEATGGMEASVSARLRDLRRPKWAEVYGPCAVERERVAGGLWKYRVVPA